MDHLLCFPIWQRENSAFKGRKSTGVEPFIETYVIISLLVGPTSFLNQKQLTINVLHTFTAFIDYYKVQKRVFPKKCPSSRHTICRRKLFHSTSFHTIQKPPPPPPPHTHTHTPTPNRKKSLILWQDRRKRTLKVVYRIKF